MNEIEARGKIKYRIANEIRKAGENKEEYEDLEIALQVMKEIREYRAVGTVEELQALKEKNEAKKVQYDEYGKEEGYPYCKCGKCLIDDLVGVSYCPNCGQKLDWE